MSVELQKARIRIEDALAHIRVAHEALDRCALENIPSPSSARQCLYRAQSSLSDAGNQLGMLLSGNGV